MSLDSQEEAMMDGGIVKVQEAYYDMAHPHSNFLLEGKNLTTLAVKVALIASYEMVPLQMASPLVCPDPHVVDYLVEKMLKMGDQ